MLAINFFSGCRAGMLDMTRRTLRVAIVAASATILSAVATSAFAATDDSSDPLKAAAAYSAYLGENAPGLVDALVDYSEENSKPQKCDRNQKPRVAAVLIGATDAGAPFNKLSGPDNDVELIYNSLLARGVDQDYI